jgi:hypothetical protein
VDRPVTSVSGYMSTECRCCRAPSSFTTLTLAAFFSTAAPVPSPGPQQAVEQHGKQRATTCTG